MVSHDFVGMQQDVACLISESPIQLCDLEPYEWQRPDMSICIRHHQIRGPPTLTDRCRNSTINTQLYLSRRSEANGPDQGARVSSLIFV